MPEVPELAVEVDLSLSLRIGVNVLQVSAAAAGPNEDVLKLRLLGTGRVERVGSRRVRGRWGCALARLRPVIFAV
jgi:hypothetical protein